MRDCTLRPDWKTLALLALIAQGVACGGGVGADPDDDKPANATGTTAGQGGRTAGTNPGLTGGGGTSPAGGGGMGMAGAIMTGGTGGSARPAPDGGMSDPAPPAQVSLNGGAFPSVAATAQVVLSEIMYHPVKEQADEDFHEYIEIYNRSGAAVALKGWKIEAKGGLSFTFADDARIESKQYRIIAKDPKKLAAVMGLGLTEGMLMGPYKGELDNGSAAIVLKDAAGATIDSVEYKDNSPWPIAADALGVKEDWLQAADKPILKHQYRGRSLERISLEGASNHPANWEASPLDGSTPGKANTVAGEVFPIIEKFSVVGEISNTALISKAEKAVLRVQFSNFGKLEGVTVETFDDDPQKTGEPTALVPMAYQEAEKIWQLVFPAKPDNTIVRYRVLVKRADKMVQVLPRATDPLAYRAYFVTPPLTSKSRAYHMFISSGNWGKLDTNISKPREEGCNINPVWQETVPATVVVNGRVYDTVVRYNGSRYQRKNGGDIAKWPVAGPGGKTSTKALSWKIQFPAYDTLDGYPDINLNKQWQGCPGTLAFVQSSLLEAAGMPSYKVKFARLHINGAYYHYMTEFERIDEELLRRYAKPGEPLGELYKDDGAVGDSASIARGDFKPIANAANYCGGKWTTDQRYADTYERVNFDHRGPEDIKKIILDLDAAKKMGAAAAKAYFEKNWDVDFLLTSYAVQNWAGVWDDTVHNYYPLKRPDGKWVLIQQDFEWTFGLGGNPDLRNGEYGLAPWNANVTFYIGSTMEPSISKDCEITPVGNPWRPGWKVGGCNALGYFDLKDQLLKIYKSEFENKLRALSKTVLSPATVNMLIDKGIEQYSLTDWNESPAVKSCTPTQQFETMRAWVKDRHAALTTRLKP